MELFIARNLLKLNRSFSKVPKLGSRSLPQFNTKSGKEFLDIIFSNRIYLSIEKSEKKSKFSEKILNCKSFDLFEASNLVSISETQHRSIVFC